MEAIMETHRITLLTKLNHLETYDIQGDTIWAAIDTLMDTIPYDIKKIFTEKYIIYV